MIIEAENIVNYLNPFSDKYNNISRRTKDKLLKWKEKRGMHGLPSLEHIFIEHQIGKISLRSLSLEICISDKTLSNLLKNYSLPTLTHAEAVRENWKDEDFRKRQAEAVRGMLDSRWKDEDFRKRQAEAVREARNNPKNHGKYFVPTLQGYRRDINLNTYSAWEANLARVIHYVGRDMIHQEPFKLKIPEIYKEHFNSDIAEIHLDFITTDNRNNFTAYEIMAHYLKSEKDWIKLELFTEQYNMRTIPITSKFYRRLEGIFKDKINSDSRFAGWENLEDNIISNPEKYK